MSILYTIIILALIQLPAIKTMESSSNVITTLLKETLEEFHYNELQILNEKFCEKVKILSEKLLEDQIVQLAATKEINEFKNNITDFLYHYPYYIRYKLFSELADLFRSHITDIDNSTTDSLYINQLLNTHGYNEITENYDNIFKKFVQEKFLPKFEELTSQLTPEELKKEINILDVIKDFKNCHNYDCFHNYFIRFIYNPKQRLSLFNRGKLIYLNMYILCQKSKRYYAGDNKRSKIATP
ncbi:uncharacterized protein LOC119615639 [Lucilia sericata]|uniref:uncharacterized protein LOC119615639 n=1 Tax=Lucilia sericata TaxID=13632 RepID=UPI0018A85EE1|nr:uncharacterized protein LOC119615639 [Lucilia sericata]